MIKRKKIGIMLDLKNENLFLEDKAKTNDTTTLKTSIIKLKSQKNQAYMDWRISKNKLIL